MSRLTSKCLQVAWIWVGLGFCALGGLVVCCSETVNHKISGDTTAKVEMTQGVCTAANGFLTPEDKRMCILCMRNTAACEPCKRSK